MAQIRASRFSLNGQRLKRNDWDRTLADSSFSTTHYTNAAQDLARFPNYVFVILTNTFFRHTNILRTNLPGLSVKDLNHGRHGTHGKRASSAFPCFPWLSGLLARDPRNMSRFRHVAAQIDRDGIVASRKPTLGSALVFIVSIHAVYVWLAPIE